MNIKLLIHRTVVLWLSLVFSSITLVGLALRWYRTGSAFWDKKKHRLPEKLSKDYNHKSVTLKSGIRIHYVEAGPADGPLMLLVHGFPEFWYSWRFQIAHFSKKYRVVAIDQRGYGDSDKPEGVTSYAIDILANDVNEIIQALGAKKAVLAGHDWGAIVCWRTAMLFPDSIQKLIVMNVPHPGVFRKVVVKRPIQVLNSWYMFMFQMPFLAELWISSNDFHAFNEMFYGARGGLRNKENITAEDLEAWKYTFSKPGAMTPTINYYRCMMMYPVKITEADIVQPDTLIVWGKEDAFLVPELGSASTDGCRKGRCVYIEGASHWVQQDKPEEVNLEMERFLAEK